MFALRVDYLLGRVYAASAADRTLCEWPPHPERLFAALVSSLHAGGDDSTERVALIWLSGLGAPLICASETATERISGAAYVPTNYGAGSSPVHTLTRGKQKRYFPVAVPEHETAYFIWPDAHALSDYVAAIQRNVSRVGYLGRSHSSVAISICGAPPEPNWRPSEFGTHDLRVFGPGTLELLEASFAAEIWPVPSARLIYGCEKEKRKELASGTHRELVVLSCVGQVRFPVDWTIRLTDALRRAMIAAAARMGVDPAILHGHAEGPHCAFLALPFAGDHGDGEIKGFAIALPRNSSVRDRRAIVRLAASIDRLWLSSELPDLEVALALMGDRIRSIDPDTWCGPSRLWGTVTPILLDRYPKRGLTEEAIVAESLQRLGFPPAEIVCSKSAHPSLGGIPAAGQFTVLRAKNEKPRWAVHATLRFGERVNGPLLVGAGRYFGLGLFQPIHEPSGDRSE